MIALTVALAVLVGLTLGLLGGGGSILTVPLLTYVAGLEAKQAITMSLLVVGITSVVGAISHARAGRVQWRTGVLFGTAGMAGAFGGGLISRFIPGTVLLIAFAIMMAITAVAMVRGRRTCTDSTDAETIRPVKAAVVGLTVGLVTGLLGAGGGFLVVPALALLGGLTMPVAVGTSLVVIAMNSFAGLAGHLTSVTVDWRLAAMVVTAAVAGGLVGARLTAHVNPDTLRAGFGWFVLIMASVILAEEVAPAVGISTATLTLVAGVLWYGCRTDTFCPLRTLMRHRSTAGIG